MAFIMPVSSGVICKTFCFLKVSMVWFPFQAFSTPSQQQKTLWDELRELSISSVIHSEPDLPGNWILCLPLSIAHYKVHKVR